jgi:hypothetical protein
VFEDSQSSRPSELPSELAREGGLTRAGRTVEQNESSRGSHVLSLPTHHLQVAPFSSRR